MNMFPICMSLLSSLGLLNLFPLIQVPFRDPRSLKVKIKSIQIKFNQIGLNHI